MLKSRVTCFCWERQRKGGQFSPYPPVISNCIEATYLSNYAYFAIPRYGGDRDGVDSLVFFGDPMIQTDLHLHQGSELRNWLVHRKPIELVVPLYPDITAYWMWNDGMDFVSYDIQSSVDIELAFMSGVKNIDLSLCSSGLPYTIDFYTMEQLSQRYGTRRAIQRHPLPSMSPLQSLLNPALSICSYFSLCSRFLKMLDIPAIFGNKLFDSCFCLPCASQRNEDLLALGCHGDPPKQFTMPWSYAKFALRSTHHTKNEEVFNSWHVCYHGTSPDAIGGIVNLGRLVKPGDVLPCGKRIQEGTGHFNENFGPPGFNSKQIFFSPVVEYSYAYAPKKECYDSVTNTAYMATTILEVRLKPHTYTTGPSTLRENMNCHPCFQHSIEWMTEREGVHQICGILVRMQPKANRLGSDGL